MGISQSFGRVSVIVVRDLNQLSHVMNCSICRTSKNTKSIFLIVIEIRGRQNFHFMN